MRAPLFDFTLRELDQIQPWGAPEDPNLHWFGLSDGTYWMNVGQSKLFEYTAAAQSHAVPKFCDYQVVRLYEDLLEIVPYVLEPVPPELQPFIALAPDLPWDRHWHAWRELPASLLTMDDGTDLIEVGAFWQGQRTLSSLHLAPPANIRMWSDATLVHIQWDNRGRDFEGVPAWTATAGTYALERTAFVDEVLSFHSRFMGQMARRVERVMAGALPDGIRVDLDGLSREQYTRSLPIDRSLAGPPEPTDWPSVAKAVQLLEARASRT